MAVRSIIRWVLRWMGPARPTPAQRIYPIDAESRAWPIARELRVLAVPETLVYAIAREIRVYPIPFETRILAVS